MPYNALLAQRIDLIVADKKGFSRKQLFGGVGYLLHGNMCVGVFKDDLIIRFDPAMTETFLNREHVKPFDITGRAMKGWGMITPEGQQGKGLENWFATAFNYVKKLPPKK